MKVSDNTPVSMPIKNMIGIVVAVAMGVFAYTEITARVTSLETSRELHQADLLKKSEQKPTDQEQFMHIEGLYKNVEKLEKNQEQNMTNKVNIEFLRTQLDKAMLDLEKLKDNGIKNSRIEGKESSDWKLVDGIDLIIHIFNPEKRKFYELEKIWSELIPKEKLMI